MLSMKALAESLGVSQPAPYRHFSGRDGLLAAVAEDGFERFAAGLAAAAADGPAAGALERVCLAYVNFALSNIGVYRLMFSRAQLHAAPEGSRLARGADASFAFLVELVAARVGAARAVKGAVSIWSTLHGVVMLKADGLLSRSDSPEVTPADVVDDLVGKFDTTMTHRGKS